MALLDETECQIDAVIAATRYIIKGHAEKRWDIWYLFTREDKSLF